MKLKIVGTGSRGNCYVIEDSEKKQLMIECGVNISKVKKALNFDFSKVEGCFISHEHQDHCEFFREVEICGVRIYTNDLELMTFESCYITTNEIIRTLHYTIQAFIVEHDANNPLGFLITSIVDNKQILYITDTKNVRWKFQNIDYLMIECNYDNDSLDRNIGKYQGELLNRIIDNHMSLNGVLEFILEQDLELKHVVLIHKSESNLNEELAINEIGKLLCATQISIAENGMEILL
jgi:phosphoribosyl 1,2-cyclic phosphodiesterase